MESCATGNLASITQSTPGTRTRLGHFQGLCGEDAKAEMWPVSVDFGGVQAAHEGQDLPTEDLAGDQDGKARRIRGHKGGGDHLLAGLHFLFHLIASQVFAQAVVVAEVESPAQVASGVDGLPWFSWPLRSRKQVWNPLKSGSGA